VVKLEVYYTNTFSRPERMPIFNVLAETWGLTYFVKGWDMAWQEGITPWDDGDVQPALAELVQEGKVQLPKEGRALVPGCGR
jgi:hypothetical protein